MPLSSAVVPEEDPHSEFCRLAKEYRALRSLVQSKTTGSPEQRAGQTARSPLQTATPSRRAEHSEQWDDVQNEAAAAAVTETGPDKLQMQPSSGMLAAGNIESHVATDNKNSHGLQKQKGSGIQYWESTAHFSSSGNPTNSSRGNDNNTDIIKRTKPKRTSPTCLGLGGTKKTSAVGARGKRRNKSRRGHHHHHHHHHKKTRTAPPTHLHQGDCGDKEPLNLEAAMAIAFRSGDRCQGNATSAGVSVSAIRNIYRARHKQQQDRQQQERARVQALNEIHQWWKAKALSNPRNLGMSHEMFHAVEVIQDGRIDQPSKCTSRNEALSDEHREGSSGRGNAVANNGDHSVGYDHPIPTRRYTATAIANAQDLRDAAKEPSCLFDNLNWRDVLRDDLYRVGLVRDIKQLLRAGQTVRVRALGAEGPSLNDGMKGRSDWKDCQLMLRNLYMQAVQVKYI